MKKSFTAKLWKAMKISFMQAVIGMIFCGITMAHDNYGQMLNEKVSVNLPHTTLREALHAIGEQTGIRFMYSTSEINASQQVAIAASEKQLKEILDQLLTPLHIRYKVQDNERIITLRADKEEQSSGNEADAVPITKDFVTGRVIDAITRQPMAGVYVIIKNSSAGTSTDADGKFSIEAEKDDVIVFSFIGYTAIETSVNNRSVIDIELNEDLKTFTEVIVNAGYYEVKEKEQTGNISKVTSAQIATQPVSNPLQALQGRVPGVYIQQANGVPGSNLTVRIRGQNSLTSGNDPLYIIDNVPFMPGNLTAIATSATIIGTAGISPLNSINPADIESIEVLKDADATAIYGSRGANGVILITTKKGKTSLTGMPKVDINVYTGFSTVAKPMDLLSTSQYIAMRKRAFVMDNVIPTATNAPELVSWDTTRYTNWQKTLTGGTARTTNIQASLSGGGQETQYSFSAGYEKQGTVFPGDLYAGKLNARFTLSHATLNKKFRASFSALYSLNRSTLIPTDFTRTALILAPDAPALYQDDGTLNWENNTWQNPLAQLELKYKNKTDNLVANASFAYKIIDGLEVSSSFGFSDMHLTDKNIRPSTAYNPVYGLTAKDSQLILNTGNSQSWIAEPKATWNKTIGQGQLNILAGATYQQKSEERLVQYGQDFASNALIESIRAAAVYTLGDYVNTLYRYTAGFGRINYNHAGKYIINITGRRDGSSRFGPGNRFANFGAVGAAWIFTKENFLLDNRILSFGKWRASYGTSGNDQIGDYRYLSTYSPATSSYQNIGSISPTRLYNPDFAWELNKKLEVGLELGFWNDRINISSSFYRNRSSNQLINYPLAMTTGFTGVQANLEATIQNQGWEGIIQSTIMNLLEFKWTTALNVSIPNNKLIAFPLLEYSSYANRYVIGEPITITKRYQYNGIDETTGTYTFEDLSGDGRITTLDQAKVTNIAVKYHGGWNNSWSYKGIQLEIFFQFVKQNGVNYWASISPYLGSNFNQPIEILDNYWNGTGGADKQYQRLTMGANSSAVQASTRYNQSDATVTDASFIRLKNVSLSYSLPATLTRNKLKCRLYVQGQNVLTITRFFGLDPENYSASYIPPLRTFSTGVQLTF